MNKYFFICLTCLLALSCAKNDADEFARLWTGDSFVAHTEDLMSRTALYDNVKVKWIAGDEVAVYADGTGPVKFTTDTSGPSVEFSSQTSVSGSSFLFTYPFSSACGLQDGNPVVEIPHSQNAVKDSFDPDAAVIVSSTSDMDSPVLFHHAHALVVVDVPQDLSGRVVEFAVMSTAGEPLAGRVVYDMSKRTVQPVGEVYAGVSLKASPAFDAGRYCLTVCPGTLARGFLVKAILSDGSVYSRTLDYSYTFEAGRTYYLGYIAARKWQYTTSECEITTVMGAKSGTVSTVAGIGLGAKLFYPQDIIAIPDGNYYLTIRASEASQGIWKMTPDYHLSKVVTSEEEDQLIESFPWSGSVASDGLLYFAAKGDADDPDVMGRIMTCSASGAVETLEIVNAEGEPLAYKNAMKVDFDAEGNMFALFRHTLQQSFLMKIVGGKVVREWSLPGTYDTFTFVSDRSKIIIFGETDIQQVDLKADVGPVRIAGTGTGHRSNTDYTDGQPGNPLTATVSMSEGCYCAPDGVIYFGDVYAYTLRSFRPDVLGDYAQGTIITVCGTPYINGYTDGAGNQASLKYPGGIAGAPGGLYLIDGTNNGTVRKVTFNTETIVCSTEGNHDQYDGTEEVESIF